MRHHANGSFDWLISGQQSVNLSREAIPILSGKYKRFTFVHPGGILMISPLMVSSKLVKVSQKRCLRSSIESEQIIQINSDY